MGVEARHAPAAVAGDRVAGRRLNSREIQPFIWRRALDFGAIDENSRQFIALRRPLCPGPAFGPGLRLKRGRGGIREAEFFARYSN